MTLTFHAIIKRAVEGFGILTEQRLQLARIADAEGYFTAPHTDRVLTSAVMPHPFADTSMTYQFREFSITPGGAITLKLKNKEPLLLRDVRVSVASQKFTPADDDLIQDGMIQLVIGSKRYAEHKLWASMDARQPTLSKPLFIPPGKEGLSLTFWPGRNPRPAWTADVDVTVDLEPLRSKEENFEIMQWKDYEQQRQAQFDPQFYKGPKK